jgi:hypothetical protein
MRFANAIKLDRRSGGRRGICCAPTPQTKAPRVSSRILPKRFVHQERTPDSLSAAAPNTNTYAAFLKESRMCFTNATELHAYPNKLPIAVRPSPSIRACDPLHSANLQKHLDRFQVHV